MFFLGGDFFQMRVDSQTRSKPLKTSPNHPENRLFQPEFYLSFSYILQKPWGGWVGKQIWISQKKTSFLTPSLTGELERTYEWNSDITRTRANTDY